jgi:two-component system nitrogen regulation sensor histidine kinase NtrY
VKSRSLIFLAASLFFLLTGSVTAYFSFQLTTPEAFVSKIEDLLSKEVERVDKETKFLLQQLKEEKSIDLITTSDRIYLLYDRGELLFWSNNRFIPARQTVNDAFTVKLLKTATGDYLAKKWKVDESKFLVSIIPLHWEFKIRNNYLSSYWNETIFPQGNVKLDEPNGTGLPVCIQEKCILKISFLDTSLQFHEFIRWVSLALFFLALLSFVLLFYSALENLKNRSAESGLMWHFIFLLPLRILLVIINFPNRLIETDLFDPQNFASSNYNASLGDLILNELLLLAICYYLFRNYTRFKLLRSVFNKPAGLFLFNVLCSLCVLFAALFPFVVIQTLYNNSSIPLDISQSISFDPLRIVVYVAILMAWGCAFLFSHVFIRLLISNTKQLNFWLSLLTGILLFVAINELTAQVYLSSLLVACFYFLIVSILELYSSLRRLTYLTFVYLFITVFCFSINGCYAIYHFNEREKIENQFRFANNFLIDRDYFSEYLLNEVSMKIQRDAFIRSRMSSPFLGKDIVRQKIRQIFLPTYFNKYDVEIFLFNATGEPYDNRSVSSFSQLISLYDKEAFRTDYKEVHYINSPSSDVTQKYLVIAPINRFNAIAGYAVVELSLKKIIPESVYPELLVDNRYQQFYKTQDLSYAVFSNKNIVFSAGDFNYEGAFNFEWLGNAMLYKSGIKESGYVHIAQEDELGRAAVVSAKNPSPLQILSNFSFLLVLGLAVILLLILSEGLFGYVRGNKLFFSTRIQLFLNISFFLPLIIVSVTTLGLTGKSSKEQLDEEYISKSKSVGTQIVGRLDDFIRYDNENQIDFENQLTDLAKLTNLDANVYNPHGILTATSQPLIFENNLLSPFINPVALKKIVRGENLFIEKEEVGSLQYFVSYASLKSPQSGKLIGILGIPFFQSVHSLEKIRITIFTNILNIFAAIFIVLLLLSFFVSEWLTFPLRFITQTLKKTSLVDTNQPLVWRADDEIGLMVKEYNKMLYKLGESKAELEQTQRERAWREIAQQVAHEIKNPLTPMKLTLQQMVRAIQSGTTQPEKTEKSLASLLEQVDTLSDIASSFSTFAKMPEPVIQRLELVSLVQRIVNLHKQTHEIVFRPTQKEVFVLGDEQLLGRSFSNIILNAIQSERPGILLTVNISLEKVGDRCIMKIKDNGKGIPAAIADQIFVPHFTTKKSGSGLGLAIVKKGIEQLQGRIWFDTTVGMGTIFYIELPVAQ